MSDDYNAIDYFAEAAERRKVKDTVSEKNLLVSAVRKGCNEANDRLGEIYENGGNGVTQDIAAAHKCRKEATKSGIPLMEDKLADFYKRHPEFKNK